MKAVGYRQSLPIDQPESLIDVEIPEPAAGPHDLIVAVKAISVNPVDTKVRMRAGPAPGEDVKVLGYDAAGVVKATGAAVTLFKPGDEVFYAGSIARSGTNAELHAVDERIVGPKPRSLDFAQASALPLTSITAWELLFDRFGLVPGDTKRKGTLLVIGGAGGVGSIMIQLARKLTGLTVIASASRPESRKWVLELGAHHAVDHSKPLADELRARGHKQVDFIASLTATDQYGISTSVPVVINIAAPVAGLTVTPPANPIQGQALSWTATLAGAPASMTYAWRVFSPDGVTRTYNTGTNNTLTLSAGALPGRYDLTVTATANGLSYTAEPPAAGTFVVVPESPINVAITVTGPQATFQEGNTVTLGGIATQAGVTLNPFSASYDWVLTGPNGFIQKESVTSFGFAPQVSGNYTATLTVKGFKGVSAIVATTFAVAHVPPKPILRYVGVYPDGTIEIQAVVTNPRGVYTYAIERNGQPFIPSTQGGSTFKFRIPPVTVPTKVTVAVTDSTNASTLFSTTLLAVATGTLANPVLKTVTAADFLPGTNVAVVLAQGFDRIAVDPNLPATATVEFIAIGGNNVFIGGSTTNIFQGDSGTNSLVGGGGSNTFFASGNDTLVGGTGANLYVPVIVDTTTGNVLNVTAGTGANAIDLSQQDGVRLDLSATGSAQAFDSIGNKVLLSGSFQSILGSAGADTLTAASGSNISGGGGSDLLRSFNANNVTLSAGSGQVTLQASGGSNLLLLGGKDPDLLTATNVTNASLSGGSGSNDTLVAGAGSINVSLIGGSGNNDSLVAMGGSANVSLIGGSGNNDSLVAMSGSSNVSLIGGSGSNDSLIAGAGSINVTLVGGSGNNDSLIAQNGSANVLVLPNLDSANILFNVLKMTGGQGVTVGPILLGVNAAAHILTPSATVRRVVNMTALTVAHAGALAARKNG